MTTLLFWLTTLIPGFALLQVLYPEDMRRGFIATLSWSYVLTVALMTPIVVVAFTVHLSVQTVAISYLALVLAGAIVAVRYGGIRRLNRLLRSTHWFEVGLVLVAIALTVPLGASAQSDSFAHTAKIRYIRDIGFYLQDAYSPLTVIETKWHVNVHHAFFAVASWLFGTEPLDLWFKSAWFFRLLAIGAVEFLGTTIFRSRWIGAVSMLGAIAVLGTKLTIVFPFSVTAFAICPILLALVLDVLERPSLRHYARVVLCSLTLAVLHVGTWFLAVLCIGPTVAWWTMWRKPLSESWRPLALAAATLVTGVPFLLVSALQPNYVVAQQDALHLRFLRTINFGTGWSITTIDPTHFAWMLPMLAVLALLIIAAPELRNRVSMLTAIMVVGMLFMFVPGIFDLLIRIVPYWLVQRFRNFGEIIGLVTVAGGAAWLMRPRLNTRLARAALALLVLCGGLAAFRTNLQGYVLASFAQQRWLREAQALQDTVRPVMPPHSLVAADPEWSLVLPSVQLARVLAADLHHANPADGGLLERYADGQELLADTTSNARRREILAKHGVKFILLRDRPGAAGSSVNFDSVGKLVTAKNGFRVYEVAP